MPTTPDKPIAWLSFDDLIYKLEEVAKAYPKEDKSIYRFFTFRKHNNQQHASNLEDIGNEITREVDAQQLKEAELLLKLHKIIMPIKQSTLLLGNIKNTLIFYPPFQTLDGLLSEREVDESDDHYVSRLSTEIQYIEKEALCKQFVQMAELRGVKYKTEHLVAEAKMRAV